MEASVSEYLSLSKSSPTRPVDWRWRRASAILGSKRKPDRFSDDKYVQAAWKFAKIIDKIEEPWEYVSQCIVNYDLASAYEIYNQQANKFIKWELEARLIAQCDIDLICSSLNVSKKCVRWYECLFFNVSDRLESQSWIYNFAIGRAVFTGATEKDLDVLWKLYGYLYGQEAVDWLVFNKSNPDVNKWAHKEIVDNMVRKQLHSSKIVAPNSWNQLQLLQMYQKDREIEAGAGARVDSDDSLMGSFMKAMSEVVSTGSNSRNNDSVRWIKDDVNAAEPRAEEALLIANGDTAILEGLTGTKLPEAAADGDTKA